MNREETLALYELAQKEGVEAWNKWANEMLEERKRLEESGEWQFKTVSENLTIPGNNKTKLWFEKSEANFSDADTPHIFRDDAKFSGFHFPANANFSNSTFTKFAEFDNCVFFENAVFNNVNFKDYTNYSKAKFEKNAIFTFCNLTGVSIFTLIKFNKFSSFEYATFNGITFFLNCKFSDESNFSNSTFNNKVDFTSSKFIKNVLFINANFNDQTIFSIAQFFSFTDFNSINAENSLSLERVKFHKEIPNFIQASFKEAPRLDNIEFGNNVSPGNFLNSINSFIHPDIKARYQALKRFAIQAHDHENEQRFWAGELRSDRSLRTEDGSWNLRPLVSAFWWGNIAYGCVSDYGRSIVRPIGTLLFLICLMTGLHLTKSKTPLTYDKAFSAGYIAANKSFLYLGTDPTKRSIIKEKYSALYGANENQTPKIPKTILTAEFFQTLLSAIFIFLALLGIRNNFKMK